MFVGRGHGLENELALDRTKHLERKEFSLLRTQDGQYFVLVFAMAEENLEVCLLSFMTGVAGDQQDDLAPRSALGWERHQHAICSSVASLRASPLGAA